jgi:hypothetical protein
MAAASSPRRGRISIGGEQRPQARTAARAAGSGRNRPVVEPLIEVAMTGPRAAFVS